MHHSRSHSEPRPRVLMAGFQASKHPIVDELDKHRRIIWALIMRELATRYGRDDLGFLWVLAEPMIFALAVAGLWNAIRPPFEYGVRVIPFTITGYMPLILVRQTANYSVRAVRVNQALLYHRQVTPLHLFISRFAVETLGVSFAYFLIVLGLNFFGIMPLPKDILVLIAGWALLAWMSFGLALVMGALSELYDFVERFINVITYIMIPLSGAFYMAVSLPPAIRKYVLLVPFIHCFELMRGAYFGEFMKIYANVPYAVAWSAALTLMGLLFVQFVRGRLEID